MTALRLGFYVLYIVLGAVIIARMLSTGLRWQVATGIIFGLLLVALGSYRIALFVRSRSAHP